MVSFFAPPMMFPTTSELVVAIAAAQSGFSLQSLFSPEDWSSAKAKRVIVQTGVVVSGAVSAQNSNVQASWGGELVLENRGSIRGLGGVPSGLTGGNALGDNGGASSTKKSIIRNYGALWAGGGSGGQGGAGSTSTNARDPVSGQYYSASAPIYQWSYTQSSQRTIITWNGAVVYNNFIVADPTSLVVGDYTYSRGTFMGTGAASARLYGLSRTGPVVTPTTGGDGGRGEGHDGSAASGSSGGTNAGAGGAGGAYGQSGSQGSAGNAGSGSVGGVSGLAYSSSIWSFEDMGGEIKGRTV